MGRVPTQHSKVPRTGPSILQMSQTSSTTLSERLPLKHTTARGSVQHALVSETLYTYILCHTGSVQYQTSSALVRLGPTKALLYFQIADLFQNLPGADKDKKGSPIMVQYNKIPVEHENMGVFGCVDRGSVFVRGERLKRKI